MLVAGLCLYKKCFPYAVRNGVPNDCLNQNYYERPQTISIAREILESDERTVTPHIRSGHFRLLQSERFKKKRFQVVFVKGCFVKGQAKTIEDINERKQLQSKI